MTLAGTTADEVLLGGAGSDSVTGGGGFDVLAYDGLSNAYDLRVLIAAPGSGTVQKVQSGIVAGTDTISGISAIVGGAGNDLFDLSGSFGAPSIGGPVMGI